MKSHDHLLDRQYDEDHYNCVHFVHEAAMDLYGIDRAEALELFMKPKREGISAIKIEVTKSIAHAQGRLHSRLSL
ncbi:hypothetical protein J968_4288 [Acinetobacter baumannii 26016_2]|nr:hypothetical protein J968_4288 [Acinetobacter baumannii 26016_2]